MIRSRIRRPKNTPVVSPSATSSTTTAMLTMILVVGDSIPATSSGATRTPMIAPPSTPTKDSSATAIPCRHPDTPAITASSRTIASTQLTPATPATFGGKHRLHHRATSRRPARALAQASPRPSVRSVSHGCAQPPRSNSADNMPPVNPHTSSPATTNAGPT